MRDPQIGRLTIKSRLLTTDPKAHTPSLCLPLPCHLLPLSLWLTVLYSSGVPGGGHPAGVVHSLLPEPRGPHCSCTGPLSQLTAPPDSPWWVPRPGTLPCFPWLTPSPSLSSDRRELFGKPFSDPPPNTASCALPCLVTRMAGFSIQDRVVCAFAYCSRSSPWRDAGLSGSLCCSPVPKRCWPMTGLHLQRSAFVPGRHVPRPPGVPDTTESTTPHKCYVFPYTYVPMIKLDLYIRHSKRGTTVMKWSPGSNTLPEKFRGRGTMK